MYTDYRYVDKFSAIWGKLSVNKPSHGFPSERHIYKTTFLLSHGKYPMNHKEWLRRQEYIFFKTNFQKLSKKKKIYMNL